MLRNDEVNKSTSYRELMKNCMRAYPGNEKLIFFKMKEKYYTDPYIKSGDKGNTGFASAFLNPRRQQWLELREEKTVTQEFCTQ